MAKAAGFAPSTIHRIWKAFNLQPHRTEDVQALNRSYSRREGARYRRAFICRRPNTPSLLRRTKRAESRRWTDLQPLLPVRRAKSSGAPTTIRTHGTLTLFGSGRGDRRAAVGLAIRIHRGREFLSFLREIERDAFPNWKLRLIMDNYATRKRRRSESGSARDRWHVRFTPTASSWVKLVERFSPPSPKSKSAAASTAPLKSWKGRSDSTSRRSTTIQNPSAGPDPPTIFSPP